MKIKEKKYYTVYKIVNKINKKEYIGFHSTDDLDDGYMGSGKLLPQAYEKYGIQNFEKEYIAIFNSLEEAESLEEKLVNRKYVERDDTYNISIGGNICILYGEYNGFFGKEHSEETKKVISSSNKGKKLSKQHKEKISEFCKKRWLQPEYREKVLTALKSFWENVSKEERDKIYEKVSSAQKRRIYTEKERKKLSTIAKNKFKNFSEEEKRDWYNKVHTPDSRLKRSKALKNKKKSKEHVDKVNRNPEKIRKTAEKHRGMKRSEETRKKMSLAAKRRPPVNKGLVYCYNPQTLQKKMCEIEEIPEGWIRGFIKK